MKLGILAIVLGVLINSAYVNYLVTSYRQHFLINTIGNWVIGIIFGVVGVGLIVLGVLRLKGRIGRINDRDSH